LREETPRDAEVIDLLKAVSEDGRFPRDSARAAHRSISKIIAVFLSAA
jgi:hypothetical protein